MSQDPANGSVWMILWLCPLMMVATLGMQLKLTLRVLRLKILLSCSAPFRKMFADETQKLLSNACPHVLGVKWLNQMTRRPLFLRLPVCFDVVSFLSSMN